ncbi:hypothetical protein IWC96_09480 [Brevundimonas sp. BAL450]|uniref:hypothetical protein n=1 Tax=Brevundimonas sp. BAL450 TaxID=1708162 RepID=UPI0018CA78A4|nr:hypothetical protein [Brevundimonas sp. BAL450]MBG7615507.1 hypothetical protein [Brevundimonas sp. BAL450]
MSTKPPPGARIATYARYSSDRSPENPFKEQMRHLRAQSRTRGREPVHVFRDVTPGEVPHNPSQDDAEPEGGE